MRDYFVLSSGRYNVPTKIQKLNPGYGINAGQVASPCYEGCLHSEHEKQRPTVRSKPVLLGVHVFLTQVQLIT